MVYFNILKLIKHSVKHDTPSSILTDSVYQPIWMSIIVSSHICCQGTDFEAKVAELVELGFGREAVIQALRLDYLMEMKNRLLGFFWRLNNNYSFSQQYYYSSWGIIFILVIQWLHKLKKLCAKLILIRSTILCPQTSLAIQMGSRLVRCPWIQFDSLGFRTYSSFTGNYRSFTSTRRRMSFW